MKSETILNLLHFTKLAKSVDGNTKKNKEGLIVVKLPLNKMLIPICKFI